MPCGDLILQDKFSFVNMESLESLFASETSPFYSLMFSFGSQDVGACLHGMVS